MSCTPVARTVLLVATLFAGCALFDDAEDLADAGPAPVAALDAVTGEVTLERTGARAPAQVGPLFVRDALETGAEGAATVQLQDGRLLEIGPDARFVLDERGGVIVVEVARGLVLSRISRTGATRPPVMLEILTPFGLTRVNSSNSEVRVEVGADDARVDVIVGAVQFISRNGRPVALNAGEGLAADAARVALSPSKPARELTLEPIEVVVFATSGKVEVRREDEKGWRRVPRDGSEITAGEALRVGEGRSQLSVGEGSRIFLERASEAQFEGSARREDTEETRLLLRKGAVTLSLAAAQKSRVTLGGGLELESELGGQFAVQKTGDGFEVLAVTGEAQLSREGTLQKVISGETATLGGPGALPVVTRAVPAALALPSSHGLRVFHPGVREVALSWAGTPERTYLVEVAQDAAFGERVLHGRVRGTFLNVAAPRRGALHWRIFQEDGVTRVDHGSAVFAPEPAREELARLRNEVPEGSEKTTIYYQDKPPAVTFTYAPEAAAAQYRVVVYRADQLAQPVAERTVTDGRAALEAGALTEGNYVWSVTPLSPAGEPLRGGRMNKLELVYDNSVPDLLVRAPANGERVRGGAVRVQGVAPVGGRLQVNGRAIELDGKSRFDAEVSIPGKGAQQVVFRLTRGGAADTFTVRTVMRGP